MHLHRQILALESQGPAPAAYTLEQIIRDGKVTNPYQLHILARVSEFFKNGLKSLNLEFEGPMDFNSAATSVKVIEALKGLAPSEHVQLAMYLKDCITAGECALRANQLDLVKWIHFVLQKQD